MDKYLILMADDHNWGLISVDDWSEVTWQIFSDGSYHIKTVFVADRNTDNSVECSGKMRASSFGKFMDAISCDWDSDCFDVDGCDGVAWAIEQYDESGAIIRSSGPLGYIYGKKAIERIIRLLPRQDSAYIGFGKKISSQPVEDGYCVTRSINKTRNLTRCMVKYNFSLVPFAMDLDRERFIIFMLPRKDELSVFLWVYFNDENEKKRIDITAVNELMLFTKWTGEAMDVSGKYPDKIIKYALSILTKYPFEELWNRYAEMTGKINQIGGAGTWKKDELDILKEVEKAKIAYNGIMYMY